MINLIPPDYREHMDYGRKNSKVISWLTAVVFGITILFVVAIVGRLTIEASVAQATSQKAELVAKLNSSSSTEIDKKYTDFISGINSAKKLYQQQILYSRLIQKLATLLPPGSKLTTISLADKDRAINLNFENNAPGLAPTIQINLANQGEQISSKTRGTIEQAFGLKLGGIASDTEKNIPAIDIVPSTKEISYSVGVPNNELGNKQLERLSSALKNGGEFAYELAVNTAGESTNIKSSTPPNIPKLTTHSVDTARKQVDITFEANNIAEIDTMKAVMDDSSIVPFIETYTFENKSYNRTNCSSKSTGPNKCKISCPNAGAPCTEDEKICVPTSARSCQYTLRGYYDEMYSSATIKPINQKDQQSCTYTCTHRITAKYNQLFEKVDINRVAACGIDPITGINKCPVEIRAEFGVNAKFYLVNPAVVK